jgi:hypothetical protein
MKHKIQSIHSIYIDMHCSGNWGETRNIRYQAIVKGMSITKRARKIPDE